jgi:hypothetical protein
MTCPTCRCAIHTAPQTWRVRCSLRYVRTAGVAQPPNSHNHHGAPVALSTGCAMWTATTATIACADDRPECIAHELRHILDPTWDHR